MPPGGAGVPTYKFIITTRWFFTTLPRHPIRVLLLEGVCGEGIRHNTPLQPRTHTLARPRRGLVTTCRHHPSASPGRPRANLRAPRLGWRKLDRCVHVGSWRLPVRGRRWRPSVQLYTSVFLRCKDPNTWYLRAIKKELKTRKKATTIHLQDLSPAPCRLTVLRPAALLCYKTAP